MNAAGHDEIRRDLGVYVLGALDPDERDRFEEHLEECEACRRELTAMAVLPGLLTRGGPEAAAAVPTSPPPVSVVVQRLAKARRRARRRNQLLAAVAALTTGIAAVAVAVLLAAPGESGGVRYVADRSGINAIVEERAWGMAVQIEAAGLPPGPGFVAMAVAEDGHRTQVASWTDTGGAVTVEGACYLAPDEMARLEILAARDEEVVAVLRPAP